MGARSKPVKGEVRIDGNNSRVPRWGHDQNGFHPALASVSKIAECPDGGTIKTLARNILIYGRE